MKIILAILFFTLCTKLFCQGNSIDVFYGNHFYSSDYYDQLNTLNNKDLSKPFTTIGIGVTEHLLKRKYQMCRVNYFLPASVIIQDSLKFKLSGYAFAYSFCIDLIKNNNSGTKNFFLFLHLGFYAGEVNLGKNETYKQKNPFFSPKIGLQPSVRISKLMLALTIEYSYDISKNNWKNPRFGKKSIASVQGFQQSGLTTQVSLGYYF